MLCTLWYLNAGTPNKSTSVCRAIILERIRPVHLYVHFVLFALFPFFFASDHSPILASVVVLKLSILFTLIFRAQVRLLQIVGNGQAVNRVPAQ
jgi:hypothetical protein